MNSAGGTTASLRRFLPAALEIQDTPPSPAGRKLLWLLLSLFAIGLLWSIFGRVDIVVTAQGRVIPSDGVKTVQSAASGTIRHLLVAEGQLVQQGAELLALDTTRIDAEQSQLESALYRTSVELRWRQGFENWLLSGGSFSGRTGTLSQAIDSRESREANRVLSEKITEFSATVLGMEKDLSSLQAELDATGAEHQRGLATLAVLSERVNAYETLVENQHGARIQYLELHQQQIDLERSLPVTTARQRKLRTEANAANSRVSAFISEVRAQNLHEITRLQSELSTFSQDLGKVLYSKSQHTLKAPVTGTVEELQVHTIGAVLRPGQEVMKIVPGGVTVEIDALLENKDIGFIHEGLDAEVKFETFNFTKYGVIPAKVLIVSEDAIEDSNGVWKYRMRLGLDQQSIAVEDKLIRLSPGMTASVEVKTGTRRIIEFLLAPLLRYRHESIRER
jgi:membrane fusion protein, hemolysin D